MSYQGHMSSNIAWIKIVKSLNIQVKNPYKFATFQQMPLLVMVCNLSTSDAPTHYSGSKSQFPVAFPRAM